MTSPLNTEETATKRRRSRRARKVRRWILGVTLALIAITGLGALIVLPIQAYDDAVEAKKQEEIELLYKIYHRRF